MTAAETVSQNLHLGIIAPKKLLLNRETVRCYQKSYVKGKSSYQMTGGKIVFDMLVSKQR